MNRLLLKLVMTLLVSGVFYSTPGVTQESPTTEKAARVRITQGPELELAKDNCAIIRWRSNNPGGSPEHYGIVRYGTDPTNLSQTAKSPIRLNPGHTYTVFRVRMDYLTPRTTYYYTVDSMEANGTSDGVKEHCQAFHHALMAQK